MVFFENQNEFSVCLPRTSVTGPVTIRTSLFLILLHLYSFCQLSCRYCLEFLDVTRFGILDWRGIVLALFYISSSESSSDEDEGMGLGPPPPILPPAGEVLEHLMKDLRGVQNVDRIKFLHPDTYRKRLVDKV